MYLNIFILIIDDLFIYLVCEILPWNMVSIKHLFYGWAYSFIQKWIDLI